MKTVAHRPLAVIAGAATETSLEFARRFALQGYELVIASDQPLKPEALCASLNGRKVDVLVVDTSHGPGKPFLDQDFQEARQVIDTNLTATLFLIHKIGNMMRLAGGGRILITGPIPGFAPRTFQAVYNGTKAFINSFVWALRNELKGAGVTVTCLMDKMDATDVASGFDAMVRGAEHVAATTHALKSRVSMPPGFARLAQRWPHGRQL
jgi:uncharacterized protein